MSSLSETGQRDTQRQRLYDAERDFDAQVSPAGRRLLFGGKKVASTGNVSIEACQAYVDYVTTAAWFQTRWGSYRRFKVKHKVHGRATHSRGDEICLPPWARTEWAILHEMAHGLTPDGCAWHGPEFAGIFLTLVRYQLGPASAKSLREAFRRHRVRSTFLRVPAPGTCQVRKRESIRTTTALARQEARRERENRKQNLERAKREVVSFHRRRQAAETLRALVKAGEYGGSGSASRKAALATARTLDP